MSYTTTCPRCDGDGRHVHEALRSWTGSERRDDPDGFRSMMRGDYDVTCEACGGSGRMSETELEAYYDELEWRAADEHQRRQESWWG